MTQENPVPRLDLAPKLKRPLSLWNPLDYLRLLYWVFYFPQALRWYVDTFGGGYISPKEMNWRKGWELLQQNAIKRNLSLQGLMLSGITPLILSVILQSMGVYIDWLNVAGGVAFGVAFMLVFGVAGGVAVSLAFGMAGGLAFDPPVRDVAFSIAFSIAGGVVFRLACGVQGLASMAFSLRRDMVVNLTFSVALGLMFTRFFIPFLDLTGIVAESMILALTFGVVILRPESWLIGLSFNIRYLQRGSLLFLRPTSLPLPYLSVRLKKYLQHDWETGLHNANQLLAYTLQFIPVLKAINQVLSKIPSEQIIWYVSKLAEDPFDWKLVQSTSVTLREVLISENPKIRLDTPARATAAGFWYLHEKKPAKAEKAFTVVRPILYGEEMYALSHNLAIFHEAKNFDDITNIPVETLHATSLQLSQGQTFLQSSQKALLRPKTWEAISKLHRVIEDIQLVQRSVSRATRAFALNRAQGELTNILNNSDTLPQAERGLIIDIAQNWQKALLQIAGEVGEVSITKPVRNPYIIGDPVLGDRFVGREDVMRELEELWVTGEQLQSVVIYGHRRMGKTSILRNTANSVGSGVKVAYVNMLNAGNISEGVGEVLMAICDAVSDVVNVPPPDDYKLLQIPYRTFERYLKQIAETYHGTSLQGLIIALDEFEKIEELIAAGEIPQDFMGYLRGLVQMNSQVAFAFAGLHTLEEMTADYFQPFFVSVIPIHVGFMGRAATKQILANPVQLLDVETRHQSSDTEKTYHGTSLQEDFPLDYTPEALDKIYDLTHGQPYLVQLIGFQLVRRYNDQVFEMGRKRDPIFTVEEVEAVINDPQFFKRGRYYFDGVWSQAAQGAPGQQMILKILAPHPRGLNCGNITSCRDVPWYVSTENIDDESVQEALNTLKRHDVIQETEGRWYIIVELFRRWVLQLQSGK
ncbi:ATP-binding protein [Mastigocoleus sp. MO_188.B34]|uniref:AAA family ATPase n=1 Tax=Mastigocoleus sp. MO_188.B34 TaxID=3036635 RepID=UPI00262B9516|nr:ATP-binding protein [Mastigocoleus sp. MO_188.B34]MDJ0693038.1 ATP-binding protein [Mastigocoleus sp. MO_188.B34]